jgi:AhpD family alkylhydroperoxidase
LLHLALVAIGHSIMIEVIGCRLARADIVGNTGLIGEMAMDSIYPLSTSEIARKRRDLTPNQQAAFDAFGKAVFADGALPAKVKQIIAVAVAHVTQCPYCIDGHTKAALRAGATPDELMEAIWVAAEMRAGGAYAHSTLMLATVTKEEEKRKDRPAS